MSYLRFFSALFISLGLFTTPAAAAGAQSGATLESGLGRVQMVMPRLQCEGWFNAELLDDLGNARYVLDAQMTRFIPGIELGKGIQAISGGVYGQLREAIPPGVHYIVAPQPFAYVEGTWTLGADLSGTFQLTAYERTKQGALVKMGAISGRMFARELPVEGDTVTATAVSAPVASVAQGVPFTPILPSTGQSTASQGKTVLSGLALRLSGHGSMSSTAGQVSAQGEVVCEGMTLARGKLGYTLRR